MRLATVYFRQPMPYGIGLACGTEREPVLDMAARTVTLSGDLVVPLEAVMCWRVAPPPAPEPTTDETQPETPNAKRGKR
jgi:hypothetical protein